MAVPNDQKRKNAEAFAAFFEVAARNGLKVPPLTDDFTFAPRTPENGKWYFAYNCQNCGHAAPYFEDPSEGQFLPPLTGPHYLHTRCVSCGKEVSAPVDSIRSMRWDKS